MAASPTTPNAAVATEYGGFWVRFVAIILDAIIIGVVATAISPLFGWGPMLRTGASAVGVEVNYTANAVSTLLGLVYFIGFWSWRGQSPGMIPFRLRVVRAADGTKPDWVISLLRYVGLIISIVVLFIGVIWAAFDGRKQGWHDKIAGTLVVRDPA